MYTETWRSSLSPTRPSNWTETKYNQTKTETTGSKSRYKKNHHYRRRLSPHGGFVCPS
ncbi:hypothetical protein Hanom_Chr17g01573991 [Helianthus anomalus]